MPWIEGQDNHAALDGRRWSLQVCDTVRPELARAAAAGLPLHHLKGDAQTRAAGLEDGAAYLLWLDGHVNLALSNQSVKALQAYLARLGFALTELRKVA
jgi:hypothetical protein